MVEIPPRNGPVQVFPFVVTVCAIVIGGVLAVVGLWVLVSPESRISGSILLTGGLLMVVVSLLSHAGITISAKADANVERLRHLSADLLEVFRKVEPLIKIISDNSQISDATRSLAHREQEIETLRQAIREEMYSGDLEASAYLIEEMERRFGNAEEAQVLRAELDKVRAMTIEEKITEAISRIEQMMDQHRWERARMESDRLAKIFPQHERVQALPTELGRRRDARKLELLGKWKLAVERSEIESGIGILTELDQYLTPEEAQSLKDSARHVFKARLLNLGVQFGLAVSENRWRDALEIGLQIQQEYPNSRMAQEVASKMDTLRTRAGFVSEAEVTQRNTPSPST